MPIPSPADDVPRSEVHTAVEVMLLDDEVGDVICKEKASGKYTVTPKPHSE